MKWTLGVPEMGREKKEHKPQFLQKHVYVCVMYAHLIDRCAIQHSRLDLRICVTSHHTLVVFYSKTYI